MNLRSRFRFLNLIYIFPLAFICKYLQFNVLPAKYFYDSSVILGLSLSPYYRLADGSYSFAGKAFRALNVFGFNTLQQWAVFLAVIMNIALFIFLANKVTASIDQTFFLVASLILLNIYVFNIGKDIIQFVVFSSICFFALSNKGLKVKIIFITSLLCFEALLFRKYYIIMAVLFLVVYWVLNQQTKHSRPLKKSILYLIFIAIAGLVILKYVNPESYIELVTVRTTVNSGRIGSADANTIIFDLVNSNGSVFLYLINYIINAIRLMLPFELLFKGVQYLPFIAYQLFLTYKIVFELKCMNKDSPIEHKIFASIVCSYYFVSFLFEPDFGSFVRHESTLFLVLFSFFYPIKKRKSKFQFRLIGYQHKYGIKKYL